MSAPLLEARDISKRFVATQALSDVSAQFRGGEIVAVMGENGAGKSTLMKVLAGVHQPDSGSILWQGDPVSIPSVAAAVRLGIAFIHQELNLADNLDVGANMVLGREPTRFGPLGLISAKKVRAQCEAILADLETPFGVDTVVRDLSIGHQQMVEIAKALSQNARVLIMDEPTSSLTLRETEVLFERMRRLRDQGICVVFISHRLGEVEELADRAIVLRDGRNSGELDKDQINHDAIVSLMVGRDLDLQATDDRTHMGGEALCVHELRTRRFPHHKVSFLLHEGEIVGMAGLVGSGRSEIARAVFGIDKRLGGTISVSGRREPVRSPRDAIAAGLALVPENRKEEGLIVEMSVRDNLAMAGLDRYQKTGFVKDRAITRMAESVRSRLGIKTSSVEKEAGMLSGGNQQKVVLGKWISMSPEVFLLDEPTRGIDVMSKAEVYQIMRKISNEGAAVLFISSELEELLRISDRILVMHEGRLAGQLDRDHMTEEAVMALATGGQAAATAAS